MKQYLLSVYHPEDYGLEPEAMEKIRADVGAVNVELQQAGAWVFAGGLYPASTATVVRSKATASSSPTARSWRARSTSAACG